YAAVEEDRHAIKTHCVRTSSNKEEVQQEDWRSRYIQLLSRSKKWEKTLQLKDSTLQYLQEALQDRDIALKRQEKLIVETQHRLNFQGKPEKALLEKEFEVSLLRAKTTEQAEKLAEQSKLIGVLNSQQEKREQELLAYSKNVKRKVEKLQVRLRSVETSLKSTEEELEAYKKCFNDLKITIWKKDRMLEKSKRTEELIKSTLKRKHMDCETLEVANDKLWGQNSQMAKSITELKKNTDACEATHQQDLKMQAFCLQNQKDQIGRLEMVLRQKEQFLLAKSKELEASYKERERLAEEYETLSRRFRALTREHAQMQIVLEDMEEKMNMSHKLNMEKANSLHLLMPEANSFPTQYGGIMSRDQSTLTYDLERAEPSTNVEDFSKHDVSKMTRGARPEMRRHLSSFEEDMRKEQLCVSNQFETRTELIADQCKLDTTKANFFLPDISLTSFPKPASTSRNKWRLSDQVFILAEDNRCMETKAESKSTKKSAQSSTSSELQKIQEEIEEREIRWKQIETSMRAELNRRKVQLHEANIL
ncbi:hypothetical protein GOP47_0024621, partial [Adiantum capillus-veneris]